MIEDNFIELDTDIRCSSFEEAQKLNEKNSSSFIEDLKNDRAIIYRYPHKPVKISKNILNHLRNDIYDAYCEWIIGGREWQYIEHLGFRLTTPTNPRQLLDVDHPNFTPLDLDDNQIRNYLLAKYKTIGDWASGEISGQGGDPGHDLFRITTNWVEYAFEHELEKAEDLVDTYDWSISSFQTQLEIYCNEFLTSEAWAYRSVEAEIALEEAEKYCAERLATKKANLDILKGFFIRELPELILQKTVMDNKLVWRPFIKSKLKNLSTEEIQVAATQHLLDRNSIRGFGLDVSNTAGDEIGNIISKYARKKVKCVK